MNQSINHNYLSSCR